MNVSPLISNSNNDYSKLDDSISGQFLGVFFMHSQCQTLILGVVYDMRNSQNWLIIVSQLKNYV